MGASILYANTKNIRFFWGGKITKSYFFAILTNFQPAGVAYSNPACITPPRNGLKKNIRQFSSIFSNFSVFFHFLIFKIIFFPLYKHFISASHHYHHPPSRLPIEKSQFSIPPTKRPRAPPSNSKLARPCIGKA